MWLQRLLKQSNYGTGWSQSGGAGSDIGVGSDNVINLPGQTQLFQAEPPNREERYNARKRREKRKMLERRRKWRSSRDRKFSR